MGQSAEKATEIYQELESARKEWQVALQQFEYAVERDVIDAAVYKLLAAERKYMYLLKKAGKEYPHTLSQRYLAE